MTAEAARLFGSTPRRLSLLEPSRLRVRRRAIASPNLPTALESDPDREFERARRRLLRLLFGKP